MNYHFLVNSSLFRSVLRTLVPTTYVWGSPFVAINRFAPFMADENYCSRWLSQNCLSLRHFPRPMETSLCGHMHKSRSGNSIDGNRIISYQFNTHDVRLALDCNSYIVCVCVWALYKMWNVFLLIFAKAWNGMENRKFKISRGQKMVNSFHDWAGEFVLLVGQTIRVKIPWKAHFRTHTDTPLFGVKRKNITFWLPRNK